VKLRELLIASWGVLGVLALLTQAIARLAPLAAEPILAKTLSPAQVGLYVGWVAFSAYFEGYRAFQKRFSPRVVARALHLARHPVSSASVALAPAYCMCLFHAKPRARYVAWGTLVMVIGFIVTLRHVPQPFRGIVDGGVVVALAWGVVIVLFYFARGLAGRPIPVSPELPG
jgi:hypothetical protein